MEKKLIELILDEDELNQVGVYGIGLVYQPAHEGAFIYMSEEAKPLTYTFSSDEKRIVTGPCIIPNKKIMRYDDNGEEYQVFFSKDTVEQLSQLFLKNHNQNNFTYEHSDYISDITVVESWVVADKNNDKAKALGFNVPNGTWMMSAKINNAEIIDKIKEGKIKGFSIEAMMVHQIIEQSISQEEKVLNELKKLVENK